MAATPSPRHRSRTRGDAGTRERIDRTAYALFSRHGVRNVGVDTLAARAGVAKMTLYKHYPSKDSLALAFLRRREELWTHSWLRAEVERRGGTARDKLLAVFDVFDRWFRRADFEGCAFIRVLLEHDRRAHPVRQASVRHLETIRSFIQSLAEASGVRDPEGFARQWQILMAGTIVAALAGDVGAARRTMTVARVFLEGEASSGKPGK
jgi:AcrR family transcriptional regulator